MSIVNTAPILYHIQGDGISTSAQINIGFVPETATLISQYQLILSPTGTSLLAVTNVTSVSLSLDVPGVLTINFAAPFSYILHLTINYTDGALATAIMPVSIAAMPLPGNASLESGGNLATVAGAVAAGTINSTGQVSVGVSATQIIAANAARKGVLIFNAGTATVYIGAAGVTTAAGHILPAGASVTLPTVSAVYGISTSSQTVSFMELQ